MKPRLLFRFVYFGVAFLMLFSCSKDGGLLEAFRSSEVNLCGRWKLVEYKGKLSSYNDYYTSWHSYTYDEEESDDLWMNGSSQSVIYLYPNFDLFLTFYEDYQVNVDIRGVQSEETSEWFWLDHEKKSIYIQNLDFMFESYTNYQVEEIEADRLILEFDKTTGIDTSVIYSEYHATARYVFEKIRELDE